MKACAALPVSSWRCGDLRLSGTSPGSYPQNSCHRQDQLEVSSPLAAVATYLDGRLCVPRDMGLLPAKAIRTLAQSFK